MTTVGEAGPKGRQALPAPARLGPCRCRAPLGRGAFGSVYLAVMSEDRPYARRGEKVAVKVLERSTSDVDRERFRREAMLGQTVEHPAVVRTYDLGREVLDGRPCDYLVMEYVEGRTLKKVMGQLGAMPESLVRALAIQIAAALDAVHRAGAVHRDLKPSNVLITRDYQVKLSDLGVAALLETDRHLTGSGMFLGTLRYAAPEQLTGERVTPATDLFALGVVLYEAATAAHPLSGGGLREVVGSRRGYVPGKVSELQPQLSPFIEEVVACLLEMEPAARFASAGELLQVLRAGESSSWWRARERGDGARRPYRRRLQVPAETVFAGRERELADLEEDWRGCCRGRGRLVLIEGEAGIGKSRLLDELVRRLEKRGEDLHLLDGSDSPGSHFGPGSLAQAIVDHFGEARLEAELAVLLPRARHLAPSFAAFLSGLPAPAGAEPLPRDAVHTLFRQLARALARQRPTLWIVEDLHFASAENRALLLSLAQVAERLPLMIVATCRPELAAGEVTPLKALRHARHQLLERLSRSAAEGVLQEALGTFRLARQVARRVGGNPLFLAEMIREARNATRIEGPTARQDTADIPASIRDLLRQRLRELGEEDQALLNAGAVQGFRFDAEVLAGVRGASPLEVLERLAEIERRRGIVRGTEQGFEFDHHLLQELIYDEVPPALRRLYHRKTAEVLERGRPATGRAVPGEVAASSCEHYLKGGAAAAGLRLALAAFEHLGRQNRPEKLLELAVLVSTSAPADDALLRCEARLQQTECLFQLGRRDEEKAAAAEALALAEAAADPSRAARARLMQGRALVDSGLAAREVLEDARARARDAGDRRTLVRILGQLGMAHLRAGRFDESLRYWQRQLALSQDIGDLEGAAEAGFQIGIAYLAHDQPEDGRKHLESNAALCRERGLYGLQVRAEGYLAAAWTQLGRYDRARQVFEQSLRLCEELGFLEAERVALGNFTMMCLLEGGLEEAAELYDRWLDRARPMSSPFLETYFRYTAAELARARGELDRARQLCEEALEICEPLAARHAMAHVLIGLGRVCFEQGDRQRASDLFQRVLRLVGEHGIKGFAPLISAYLAALGEIDPDAVEVPDSLQIHLRAEAHWMLHRAGARGDHLARASRLLRRMSAHLEGRRRADFWSLHPVARAVSGAGRTPPDPGPAS